MQEVMQDSAAVYRTPSPMLAEDKVFIDEVVQSFKDVKTSRRQGVRKVVYL